MRGTGRIRAGARTSEGGFTLLEVLVAITILASALVVVLNIVTRNVRASNHAQLTTAATFLARAKIVDVEDQIVEQGFVDNDQEEQGDFSEQGFANFRWRTLIEKVELPTDLAQQAQDKAQDMTESTSPMSAMAGLMGGFMSTLVEPVRLGLEASVRRVTVEVKWDEFGRGEQSIKVETFLTDPSKLDMAMGGMAGLAGAASMQQAQQGTQGGAAGAGGQSTGSGARSSPTPPRTTR
jgi:general secretion pathway protein I